MTRKIVFYTGRVQGVGFRYMTASLAKRFVVAGYVQNLHDGRVRLDVQGDAEQVAGLLAAVAQAMANNITAQEINDAPPDPNFGEPEGAGSFGVRS